MIARLSLTSALALAALLAPAAPAALAAAPAAATPGYLCSSALPDEGRQWIGLDDCEARGGAPAEGPIQGTFTITSRSPRLTVTCTQPTASFVSGIAETPDRVTGYQCRR
ncbi:hypothetical protein [Actinomadura sp. NEAU-AAG7]|uniref:hypothetical protein n=1 Tax=Actinomadura sp. NEAU-AAG7 TaxID=2839640 RepID=UPI001BE46840|nr:hypothetical protein [Actinomadura sp. NEAU-AAG7]MBT2207723.1 hypothetical protein [Actinomadura sp. NEAU-AAG7]